MKGVERPARLTQPEARDHWIIEPFVGLGWCATHSRFGSASRIALASTFPAAIRRFHEVNVDRLPAVIRGGGAL